jgi:hypothetical protein
VDNIWLGPRVDPHVTWWKRDAIVPALVVAVALTVLLVLAIAVVTVLGASGDGCGGG